MIVASAVLGLAASCSLGEERQTASSPRSAASDESVRIFREGRLSFRYPSDWSATGFSKTVWPARLAVASYALPADAVEGDCGGYAAVEALPRDGALVIVIDYGAGRVAEFPPRPPRLRLADGKYAEYECFGASTMFSFRVGDRRLQAHVALGTDADASRSRQALKILDSIAVD